MIYLIIETTEITAIPPGLPLKREKLPLFYKEGIGEISIQNLKPTIYSSAPQCFSQPGKAAAKRFFPGPAGEEA
jgi:hypothetical protein